FWKDRLVEIKGVEPFLPVPYPGFLFSIICELLLSLKAAANVQGFLNLARKKNNFFSQALKSTRKSIRRKSGGKLTTFNPNSKNFFRELLLLL
ncbi:hypothetical protein SAMN06296241_1564, partial [Salinimicrobium sediminis]